MSNCKKNSKGFTLAEILVTLAIIGVVAALTIPSLIQNTRNAATVAQLRKTQSMISQAYKSFEADGVSMDELFGASSSMESVIDDLCIKLNCAKKCGRAPGCFAPVDYLLLNGDVGSRIEWSANGMAILADGTCIEIATWTFGCTLNFSGAADPTNPLYNVCGYIGVDINGFNGPNQWGRDTFAFWVTRTGVYPRGSHGDNANCTTGGSGCTSKILTEGAVNY